MENKILKVAKPFAMMEVGDTFELSENGMYVSKYDAEESDDNKSIYSSYSSRFEISPAYAEVLMDEDYLTPEKNDDKPFVNVFEEIKTLRDGYAKELEGLDKEFEGAPACLKVEKETVLCNMIKVLDHLNSLKK